MYIPAHFACTDRDALHTFVRAHAFGTLISVVDGAPFVTILPFMLVDDGVHGTLIGHVARANPHGTLFDGAHDTLALFQGPHAYVSPSWYATPVAVPTWNFTAVEAHGRPQRIDDPVRLHAMLTDLVATYEGASATPWTMDGLPREFTAKMIEGIIAFEMPITRLDGKFKLSQNRSQADRAGVRTALRATGDPNGVAVADLMAE